MEGLNLDQLRNDVQSGRVDTVLLALPGERGSLVGPRLHARHFVDALGGGAPYGALTPDLSTLRRLPWREKTALAIADPAGDEPAATSSRALLRRQLARLDERGLRADAAFAIELRALSGDGGALEPLADGTAGALLGTLASQLADAGIPFESVEGRAGRYQLRLPPASALDAADALVVTADAAQALASAEDATISFMARLDEAPGSAARVQLALARTHDGSPVFGSDQAAFEQFLAGQLSALRELSLLHAPHVNSYKRLAGEPPAIAWSRANPATALRAVGSGDVLRIELRVPGADLDPYLSLAAIVAAGLHGFERELALEAAVEDAAALDYKPRVPTTLREAHDLLAASRVADDAFGEAAVAARLDAAREELAEFERVVTDWERRKALGRG